MKIRSSGICGSDVNSYTGRTYEGTFPYVPGHEWSGEVEEVGDGVTTLKKGDKVVGETVVGCGLCDKCKAGMNPNFCRNPTVYGFQTKAPGAFAQYVLRDESNLSKLPASLTYDQGASSSHSPWHTTLSGVSQVASSRRDTVVVFGAGPVGLFALAVVKGSRARAISVDPIEMRRELALKLGADHVVDPKAGRHPGGLAPDFGPRRRPRARGFGQRRRKFETASTSSTRRAASCS